MTDFLSAGGRHLETLKFLLDQNCECNVKDLCTTAAEKNHVHVLRWLKKKEYRVDMRAVSEYAARGGHLELMKWAKKKGGYGFRSGKRTIRALEGVDGKN